MALIVPAPVVAQGPQTANLLVPRTTIPLAAGFSGRLPDTLVAGQFGSWGSPAPAPTPVYGGSETRTTLNDWYYRVHVTPTTISLGNLAGDVTRRVLVWNAYLDARELTSVALSGPAPDGVVVGNPVPLPLMMDPLRVVYYDIAVSGQGPAVVEATVTWTVDGAAYPVSVSARRSTLWPFAPNWASKLQEVLSWKTSVSQTWEGSEQRMRLAREARRALSYTFAATRGTARQLDALLYGWQGRSYVLPLWHEERRLAGTAPQGSQTLVVDTTGFSAAVGTSVVLYADPDTYEVVEITSITPSSITTRGPLGQAWVGGSKVIPCVPGWPKDDRTGVRFATSTVATGDVDFQVDPRFPLNRLDETPTALAYQGEELFFAPHDWSAANSPSYTANRRMTDSGLGPIDQMRKGPLSGLTKSVRWVARSRQRADELRRFFARRAGRWSPVWMPSGREDFVLIAPTDPTSPTLVVAPSTFGSLLWPNAKFRHLVVELRNGARHCRKIEAVADGPGYTNLTLDSLLPGVIAPADVARVSFLGLYRLEDDSVTFNWSTDGVAVVETDFVLTEPV